ncbi:MAG: hypothetical protein LBK52_07325 [Deltaproteobacteria bacterium]|jgi:chromosome segregation ATPase|nr:hypothetical protein [Deltaproteobacteria bacterium]
MKILAFVIAPLLLAGLVAVTFLWRGAAGEGTSLTRELSQARNQISTLETQAKDLGQKLETAEASLRDAASKASASADALRTKDSDLSQAQASAASLNQENTRLKAQVQQIDAAKKEAQAAQANAKVYMEELASQQAGLTVITQERDRLKAELEQARKTINMFDSASNDISWSLGFLDPPLIDRDMLPLLNEPAYY